MKLSNEKIVGAVMSCGLYAKKVIPNQRHAHGVAVVLPIDGSGRNDRYIPCPGCGDDSIIVETVVEMRCLKCGWNNESPKLNKANGGAHVSL